MKNGVCPCICVCVCACLCVCVCVVMCAYYAGGTAIVFLIFCRHGDVDPHPSLTVVAKGTHKVVVAWRQSSHGNLR